MSQFWPTGFDLIAFEDFVVLDDWGAAPVYFLALEDLDYLVELPLTTFFFFAGVLAFYLSAFSAVKS